jgi:hypothetical protein
VRREWCEDVKGGMQRQVATEPAICASFEASDSHDCEARFNGTHTQPGQPGRPIAGRGEAAAALLEQSAMWLRENDLSDIEARVTGQLEAHPVRTLAIAAAVGFPVSRRGN